MTQNNSELIIILTLVGPALPALVAAAGERASRRFVEFFTANIRNKKTREAYCRNITAFLVWCDIRHGPRHDRTGGRRRVCREITQRRIIKAHRRTAPGRDPNAVRLDGDRRDSGDESGFGSTRPQIRHRKRKASKPKCRCLTCFDSSNSRPRDPKYLKTFCLGMSIRYQTTNASAAAWRVRARAAPNLRRSASEEIPDQHYIPMRLRDWFAPVTVIALEACIFP